MDNKDEELEKILKELKEDKKSDFSLQVESADGSTETSLPEKKEEAPLAPEITEEPFVPEADEAPAADIEEAPAAVQTTSVSPELEADLKEAAQEAAVEESEAAQDTDPLAVELVNSNEDEYAEEDLDMPKDNKKKIIIAVIAVIAVIALAVGIYFGVLSKNEEETTTAATTESTTEETTTEAPALIINPFTGSTDYNADAVGKRPIAVVVENAAAARPQYNMDTPDIIVEGEVEGGITRMLWLYADMTNLPEQVGPTRSARPPYVKFSEFFDSIFVHYGESHSKGAYVGADDVIAADGVDNINGMTISSCFKRTSDKASPHNAVLVGSKLVEAIESKGYRTDVKENAFTAFNFNEKAEKLSATPCNKVTLKFSSRTDSHTFTYNAEKDVYSNSGDYKQLVEFTNIIIMQVNTEYIVKENYKGSGNNEVYCNYNYTSGTGKVASNGTVVDFNWENNDGVLKFTNAETGKELMLNPGRSYLALASANNGSSITVE